MSLIARLEKLKAPCRMLDADIAIAVWGLTSGRFDTPSENHRDLRHPNGRHISCGNTDGIGPYNYSDVDEWSGMTGWSVFIVPPFTASIDAAMMLVRDWDGIAVRHMLATAATDIGALGEDPITYLPRYICMKALAGKRIE